MSSSADLPRTLGLFDAVAIVVGTTVGAGIFVVPNLVALSCLGAMAYAELGAMMSATGGPCVSLRESYGPLLAFLCGWKYFFVIISASFTWLAVLVAAAFAVPPAASATAPVTVTGFGVAMIACLTAYDGWISLSAVAGEIKDPKRNLPLAAVFGVGTVIFLYVVANLAYLRALGPACAAFVSVTALFSICGSANGWSLAGPRLFFAQARDGLIFRSLALVHPRFETPYVSITVLGLWAALLAVIGTYENLAAYAMYATWAFYLLTVLELVALRHHELERPHPYRMSGYPVTLVLADEPVYFWWKSRG